MVKEELPFAEVMISLANDERPSVALLYRLSDLSPEEYDHFCGSWPTFDEERRRVIARHLADISEENFQVDFSSVFAFCLGDKSAAVRLASLDGLWDSEHVRLIEPIVQLMHDDPDLEVRTLAAATLGHFILLAEWGQLPEAKVRPAVDALLMVLDSASTAEQVRRAALESIGAATHPRVADLIADAYDSADLELQVSAVFAMGRSADPQWLSILRDEMSSPMDEMRAEAARAAGGIGRADAIPELFELLSDEDLEVRLAAVHALGQIGGETAQRILEEMAEDPDAYELFEAIDEALEEMTWLGGEIDLSLFDWDNMDDVYPSA